jgi:N-acetylneuraminic acid mutarotase
MRIQTSLGILFLAGVLLTACGLANPQIVTVEVTRIVQETVLVTPTSPPVLTVGITQGVALLVSRALHTATRLSDGRILLVGGSRGRDEHLADVEIFDPATGQTGWAAPLNTPRHGHTATLLMDGRVLVVGGYNLPRRWLDDAEVYDPSANAWIVVPPLHSHGVSHTATLMKDGRVLVVGGCVGSGVCTNSVEIFIPQTNTWTEAAPLAGNRASQTALLLDDGRVLMAGGGSEAGAPAGGDALLYDPQTNAWTATEPMVKPGSFAQSVQLLDGRILIAGGMPLKDAASLTMTASAEVYDPTSNMWTAVPPLSQPRYAFVLVLLPDGHVLAIGGARVHENNFSAGSFIHEIESYDPQANRWSVAGELPRPAAFATATLLPGGRVWASGGLSDQSSAEFSSDTWFITPLLVQP